MKTLIIDNHDSFTFNIFQYIAEINGVFPTVVKNNELPWSDLADSGFDCIVISPGPGRPDRAEDFGVSAEAILHSGLPVLGVCLGHQGIGHLFGGTVRHAPEPMHGRLSPVFHDGTDLFRDIPSPCEVVRYHSLMVSDPLPPDLLCQARTPDGVIMGLRHRSRPIWGVQFHPESISTEHGKRLFANFMDLARRHKAGRSATRPAPGIAALSASGRGGGAISSTVPSASAGRSAPADSGGLVLRTRRLSMEADAEALFLSVFGASEHAFWLDSSRVCEGFSRFSFMGDASGPRAEVVTYGTATRTLTIRRADGTEETSRTSIFDHLADAVERRRTDAGDLPFDLCGGHVGYLGYELKSECGAVAGHAASTPDAAFILADRFVAIDHAEGTTWLVHLGSHDGEEEAARWMDRMESRIAELQPPPPLLLPASDEPILFRLRHGRDAYIDRIGACLEEIRNGESYEICLTNMVTSDARPDPLLLYRILRSINPAPYAAFLRLPGATILCSSPERFLKIGRDGLMEAKPIKGTLPRGRTDEEDHRLRETLRGSEKDRAENLMIVDLLRNDLGQVSEVGSVEVPRLMDVESYATVHQMVSTIRGRLRADRSPVDAVKAAFPGGSMTGAPKPRTMGIIDRLEEGARGVYSGAIGFFSFNGAVDLNIVIRTIVLTETGTSIGCGGAVVALSDPKAEFDEIMLKARAPLQAIARAVTGSADAYRVEGIGTAPSEPVVPAPGYRVRAARESDAQAVSTGITMLLRELSGKPDARIPDGWERVYARLLRDPSHGAVFVCTEEGGSEPVGLVTVKFSEALRVGGRYGVIEELWIDPAHRGRTAGAMLLDAAADFCRTQGVGRIEVGLPPYRFPRLPSVQRFYRGQGFEEVGPRMRRVVA